MIDWDERYSEPGYAYGTQPNDFLCEQIKNLPEGRVLSLAEGEGRNAVFLASQSFDVTAVDASAVGMRKAEALAAQHALTLRVQRKVSHRYRCRGTVYRVERVKID
jgi:2-polyprenyl-3-methyl-5-hydroxy-6-metoxy-1,4-benzoquinol methylase